MVQALTGTQPPNVAQPPNGVQSPNKTLKPPEPLWLSDSRTPLGELTDQMSAEHLVEDPVV